LEDVKSLCNWLTSSIVFYPRLLPRGREGRKPTRPCVSGLPCHLWLEDPDFMFPFKVEWVYFKCSVWMNFKPSKCTYIIDNQIDTTQHDKYPIIVTNNL
jgi:hypothetical protein